MAELTLNLSNYKASGVYFLEVDNSVINSTNVQSALRMAVGFNLTGPFNRPVYLSNTADCNDLLGSINRKLERKGCFTNRNVRTMLGVSPVYVLNLLPVNTAEVSSNTDLVGVSALSFDAMKDNISAKTLFANMYDRSKFWVADEDALVAAVTNLKEGKEETAMFADKVHAPLFSVGNCGTKDVSLIVRKAEGLTGYNVTFRDWYGSEDNIPYDWINANDYVSDYFVQVIAVSGNWAPEQYESLAADTVWKEYFTKEGLKKEKLSKFLRLDAVSVLFNYTGCILPDFYDKQGYMQSIDYKINKICNKTGVLWGVNNDAIETLAFGKMGDDKYGYYLDVNGTGEYDADSSEDADYVPDVMGNNIDFHNIDASIDGSTGIECDFLSYHIDGEDIYNGVFLVHDVTYAKDASGNDIKTQFEIIDASTTTIDGSTGVGLSVSVGDYVRTTDGTMARVIKKRAVKCVEGERKGEVKNTYTAVGTVEIKEGTIEIHKSFSDMYRTLKLIPITGLKITNKHLPGYDTNGNVDLEAGVEKIYNMLEDPGIRKGLLNKDALPYRYLIDTMAYGLGEFCGAKQHLTTLAADRGQCTAICNLPSMSQFAASDKPFFGDYYVAGESRPVFNVSYIHEGGNLDMTYDANTSYFSLPDVDHGSQYAAFFTPFFKYTDGARSILVPPAADVSNTFMNKFLGGDQYKTVANLNGIISNTSINGLEYTLDTEDREYLEPYGINPIINKNGNIMIYGDRTAYQDVDSDLNFLHVRELLNLLEAKCRAVLDDYVFSYNTAVTRAEITTRLTPILSAMKDADALARYEIEIDENNNTKELIDAKFCIVDIGVWVNQNAEKIVTRITLNRSTDA